MLTYWVQTVLDQTMLQNRKGRYMLHDLSSLRLVANPHGDRFFHTFKSKTKNARMKAECEMEWAEDIIEFVSHEVLATDLPEKKIKVCNRYTWRRVLPDRRLRSSDTSP
jgi:hypothetical protein